MSMPAARAAATRGRMRNASFSERTGSAPSSHTSTSTCAMVLCCGCGCVSAAVVHAHHVPCARHETRNTRRDVRASDSQAPSREDTNATTLSEHAPHQGCLPSQHHTTRVCNVQRLSRGSTHATTHALTRAVLCGTITTVSLTQPLSLSVANVPFEGSASSYRRTVTFALGDGVRDAGSRWCSCEALESTSSAWPLSGDP